MKRAEKHPDLLQSVARSTSYNIFLQLMFRLLTFVLNAVVLRFITKELLGVVNVRLTLLYSTALFVGREAFRKSCLTKTEEKVSWQEIINVAWCCPIVGLTVALVLSYVWLNMLSLPDPAVVPYYSFGVVSFSVSAVIEMMAEPLFIIGQKLLFVRFKAVIEGLGLLVKCIISISLITLKPDLGVLAFCISQLSFSCVYVGGYYLYFIYNATQNRKEFPFTSGYQFLPRLTKDETLLNRHLLSLTWSFMKQSFLKQFLTEGERYLMTIFNVLSFADQGIFDVISNLGSLVARFFFQPLEESSYLLFSQSITRGVPAVKQQQDGWKISTEAFRYILKLVSLVGLTLLVFGYSYSQLALHLYGGSILSSGEGPYLLRWYCFYVLVLAVNGVTEAFSFAVMSKEAVDRYNYKMLGFSAGFLFFSFILTRSFGSAGFIMANCCNMAARIIHSLYVIKQFYSGTNEAPSLIGYKIMGVYAGIFLTLYVTEVSHVSPILHVSVGVICLLVLAVSVWIFEKNVLNFLAEKFLYPLYKVK